jgi:hypothetical protein
MPRLFGETDSGESVTIVLTVVVMYIRYIDRKDEPSKF